MKTTLYFKEGTSDKVYQAAVEPQGTGFIVTFAYGRRCQTLTPGTKTASPVSREAAETIYRKLVAEKVAKGYLAGADGEAIVQAGDTTVTSRPEAFIAPQLLNEITAEEAAALVLDGEWVAEPKHDGIRMQLHRDGEALKGYSRKGLERTVFPAPIVKAALLNFGTVTSFILDGELVGDTFFAFDILAFGGEGEVKNTVDALDSCAARRALLEVFAQAWPIGSSKPGVVIVERARTEAEKLAMTARIHSERGEGMVFKRLSAPYTSGPSSNQVKHKFVTTGSFIVSGYHREGKRSVSLALYDGRAVGHCTIAVNQKFPPIGSCVEVRYLYFLSSLVQAVLLGVRDDVDASECTARQLKHKQEVRA